MLLDFLRPKMNVCDDEVFSVYPGKSNNPGDIIKGRTFRRLNVTRKIVIKHVPDLIKSALDMQTFALGQRCVRQCRGSPMGSPLSPALCLMVVSISEQIWSNTFRHLMSNHHLFIRHIRYVDNRLIFGDKRLTELAPYEVLLDEGFYGKPIILETEPDQEFLGFMLETKPLELIYQGPTNISQVLSPFSASPPAVLLSGFRSRCHIVIKGAFPASRVQQGLIQLIHLYSRAGFPKEELQTISDQLLIQHQNSPSQCQTRAFCLHAHVLSCFPVLFWFSFSVSFLGFALGSFSCVAVFPCALFGSFLAQSSLALSFLLCIPDGSRPSSRFPSPPGSGSDAFELFGGAPSLFEPSIEWEDSSPPQTLRLDNMRSRSLHTFVPLPPSSAPPTLVTHGGIPSHMVENPEPNLRPTTFRPPTHMERDHPSINPVGVPTPVLMSDPNPNPDHPASIPSGREASRNTIPVPVRSKQRVSSTIDPQPKKRQKVSNPLDTAVSREPDTSAPAPLPISSDARINALNSGDSDGDGASTAASVHDPDPPYALRDESTSHVTIPPGNSAISLISQSQSTSISTIEKSSTNSHGPTSCSTIPSMDQCR